jgi:Putative transposase, YhgA-like/Domain of unknown function (DUF4351)
MPDRDSLYHRLFTHPGVVAQLLREFVSGPWLDDLDLDGMKRLNAKFHAETAERREGDMIWRVPRRLGGDTYLVLLLEFQSTPDRWMALRALVYAGLLWQHLVKEPRLPLDGRLPPVLPVVLYNGDRRWAAPLVLHELVGLPENSPLWHLQPNMRYHMVDEGTFGDEDLAGRDTLPALLFRLENSPDPEQVVALADALVAWFVRYPGFEGLRAIFAEMLGGLMEPLAPGVAVPEELLEARNMLATRAETWKQQWLQEGEQRGRQEGEQRGRREGEVALLVRLLEQRFGVLPGWARDRIATGDAVALEQWGLRVFDAGSLEDVLG